MNDLKTADFNPDFAADAEDPNLLNIFITLARYKKFIFGFTLAAALLSAGVSLILPPVYQGSTKLLPPQQAQSTATALLSQVSGMAGLAAGVGGLKNPNDLYVGMLKSRTIADRLIAQFNLKSVYETDELEKARKKLEDKTTINAGKDGLISIDVEDNDAKRAARLANGYVEELLRLTKVLSVTEASQRRLFFEQQLEQTKNKLANAEVALKGALDSRGVISVDVESRAIVETVARLKATISAKEIELNAMKAFVTASHPDFLKVTEELSSLKAELQKLENGRQIPEQSANVTDVSKNTGFDNIKILRDLKYYQMLYELLAKQYEIARLDEAKDASIIQVLDPAVEPERRIKPKRAILVLLSTAGGLIFAILIALLSDAKRRAMREPKFAAQWQELRSAIRSK